MKLNRRIINALLVLTSLLAFTIPSFGAVKYKDVPEGYWAFNEINGISDRGLIVGDASGNFRPGDPVDKFEASRILAKAMGYKYTDVTGEERAFYKQAYDKNKSIIAQYAKPYVKWKSAYDYEIAFLLEKEIFTVEDLSQFIIKDANGVQQYRALSKQEAAVYMVKLMGRKSEALAGDYDMNLSDDADIKKAYKPYVYYLLGIGVLHKDENGKFRPNEWVTRASLSVILLDSLTYIEHNNGDITPNPTDAPISGSSAATRVVSLAGNITKIFPESGSVQITGASGANVYKFAPGACIYVDSFLKTPADLKPGMPVNAVLSNNQIVDLQASGLSLNSSVMPVSNRQFSTVEGTLKEIRSDNSGVAIDLSLITPNGAQAENKTFVLDKNCKIWHDNSGISADNLQSGDMVMADISGGICLSLILEDHTEVLTGILQEIHITPDGQSVVLKTDDGAEKTFAIIPEKVDIYSLKIGMKTRISLIGRIIEAVEILD